MHAHTVGMPGGPQLRVLDLGATVASLHALSGDAGQADQSGRSPSLVLGHPTVRGYTAEPTPYFGAVVGRYANRIAGSRFTLNGTTYRLAANEGENCLHGGPGGFHSRIWTVVDAAADELTLRLTSPDGDQGFPGELTATVTYRVTASSVHIDLRAESTAPTVVNLTNHTYWNLAGEGSGSVDRHLLGVEADRFLPVDREAIPLEQPAEVAGTPLDLRTPVEIGVAARGDHPQTSGTLGIDHCYLIRGEGMRLAATLVEPATGRILEVHTDQPGLQVYTGNYLDGSIVGPSGRRYRQGDGVALETQRLPDAPNRDWLPSPVLEPGQTYTSRTEWRLRG